MDKQRAQTTTASFFGSSTMFMWRPCICGGCAMETSSPRSWTKRCNNRGGEWVGGWGGWV